jgi:cell volume regulation protein A
VKLPEKVFNIVKFESSINDPSAIIVYGVVGSWILSEAFKAGATSSDLSISSNLTFRALTDDFVGLFSTGILVGVVFGYLSIWMLKNLNIRKPQLLTAGLAIVSINYAISNYIGGSGLISAFVSGMVLINLHKSTDISIIKDMKESLMPFEELAEMFIYFSFAARIDPESLFRMLPLGLICAFIMMVIARPISIYIFQPFSSLNWKESSLLGWCGLKGSVTLALSFEMVDLISKAQVLGANFSPEFAQNIQSIIFITALTNLFVQSISISSVAKWATNKAELIEKV